MARKKSFNLEARIKAALRTISVYWPPKKEARKLAEVKVLEGTFKNGKPKYTTKYRCASCSGLFKREETQMDHKEPVQAVEGFVDWDTWIFRLFVEKEGYSCLCTSCHQAKSESENQIRRKNRKKY